MKKERKSIFKRIREWAKGVSHLYSKLIVLYCIAFASGLCIYGMYMMRMTGYDSSAIITVGVGFFGGELLCMCLKTIFDNKKKKEVASVKEDAGSDNDDEGAVG